jgi:hypothetical protein
MEQETLARPRVCVIGAGPSGIAIYVTADKLEVLYTPEPLEELTIVGDRFYLRPLLPSLPDGKHGYVLAIDSNRTRLFRVERLMIEEVPLPEGTPVSLDEITSQYNKEESLQFREMTGPAGQGGAAIFHGHGSEKDYKKVYRGQFLQAVSRGVTAAIGNSGSEPLVLMGIEYVCSEFRAVAGYPNIVDDEVQGATDFLNTAEIQKRALEILAPVAQRAVDADLDEYNQYLGTGLAIQAPEEILTAAAAGRVKTLLVDDSAGPYGYFNDEDFSVQMLCKTAPRLLRSGPQSPDVDVLECGWDIIDMAAVETLRHAGEVRAFTGEGSPIQGAGAVLRY